jgi:hypothetical protein
MWNEKNESALEVGREQMGTTLPLDGELVVGALDLTVGGGSFDALECGGDGIHSQAWRHFTVRDQRRSKEGRTNRS